MKNNKGFFFTLTVIVLFMLFLGGYMYARDYTESKKAMKERVSTMSVFLFSSEQDLQREVYIVGFRGIFIMEKEVIQNGVYVNNVTSSFEELFLNGTLNNKTEDIMNGATLEDFKDNLRLNGENMNLNITVYFNRIIITQKSPWTVSITLDANLTLRDEGNLANWNKSEVIEREIPIEGFEDPLYTLSTESKYINKINKTSYFPFVSSFDVDNLTLHAQSGGYINSSDAPSFLNRLEGSLAPSPYGIESLVNVKGLSLQGIEVVNKSIVDHIYFSGANPASYNVIGAPSWIRIDSDHSELYQTNGLLI